MLAKMSNMTMLAVLTRLANTKKTINLATWPRPKTMAKMDKLAKEGRGDSTGNQSGLVATPHAR